MGGRSFYTDPLAAAWMAKHHGFTLYIGDLEANDFDTYSARAPHHIVEDWDYRNRPQSELTPVQRVFVHPESLHLLAPKIGDLVTNTAFGNEGRECSGLIESMANQRASAIITTCERHNGKRHFYEDVKHLVIV